ncbi:MAG: PQQ-binding-like beta-propeller repeat protein [Polyangiales bacterium]
MGDAQNTGRSTHVGPEKMPQSSWRHSTGARIFASPIQFNDQLIVVALNGKVASLNTDGKLNWRVATSDKVYSTPAAANDDHRFFAASGKEIMAIDDNGTPLWTYEVPTAVDAPILVANDTVFVAASGIYAFTFDGELKWFAPTEGHIRGAPVFHPAGFVVAATTDGVVHAFDNNGGPRWSLPVHSSVQSGLSVDPTLGTIYCGTDRGKLVAISSLGKVLWEFETKGDIRGTPAVDRNSNIIFGSYDQYIYATDPEGKLLWRVATTGRVRASARVDARGNIYIGSQDNFIYALSSAGQLLWRFNIGQDVDATVEISADGTLYVGADDGAIHALR